MISRAAASSTSVISSRSFRAPGAAARSFATAQDAPPARHHGGLQDQDRIFTNLYGHHGADLKSAMKYGDWYRTKDIVLKGHDWVGFGRTGEELELVGADADAGSSLFQKSKLRVFVVVVVLGSRQV